MFGSLIDAPALLSSIPPLLACDDVTFPCRSHDEGILEFEDSLYGRLHIGNSMRSHEAGRKIQVFKLQPVGQWEQPPDLTRLPRATNEGSAGSRHP